jgi:hypothetical protein
MKLNIGDKVTVLWQDAIGESDGWHSAGGWDYTSMVSASFITATGYFIKDYENCLFLATNYRAEDDAMGHVMMIPSRSIIQIDKLK